MGKIVQLMRSCTSRDASATHSWASPITMQVPPCERAGPERLSECSARRLSQHTRSRCHALIRKGWTVHEWQNKVMVADVLHHVNVKLERPATQGFEV
jgi:hypothetical protein